MPSDDASRAWRAAVELARREREQRKVARPGTGGPGPRRFDERGFPIPQPIPAFVQRVARLINGG
jgi:hypothetical protein